MITQSLLKKLFVYENGKLFNRMKRNHVAVGSVAGCIRQRDGRCVIWVRGRLYYRSRLVWLYVKGWLPDQIDHKNRCPGDDRISNLRPATSSQNNANRNGSNVNGYKGVHRNGSGWMAQTKKGKKRVYLGTYPTKELASAAYHKGAVELHGEFAGG